MLRRAAFPMLAALVLPLLFGWWTSPPVAAQPAYEVIDLGILGRSSVANDINERGQVVGFSDTARGGGGAVLGQDGLAADLGTLGGLGSGALGINERGQVVGFSFTAEGVQRGFLWQGGQMIDLGTLGGFVGYAYGINDQGQ